MLFVLITVYEKENAAYFRESLRSVCARFQPTAKSIHLLPWIERVNAGVRVRNAEFPFLAYGTDWLAFAPLVIAIAFIGPHMDPVRNK